MLHCVNSFLCPEGGRYLEERNVTQWVLIVYDAHPEAGGVQNDDNFWNSPKSSSRNGQYNSSSLYTYCTVIPQKKLRPVTVYAGQQKSATPAF